MLNLEILKINLDNTDKLEKINAKVGNKKSYEFVQTETLKGIWCKATPSVFFIISLIRFRLSDAIKIVSAN